MSDKINRCETTYVDKKTGSAKCTAQWLLEKRNMKGQVDHPITHNNKLTMFICGQEGFGDIAKELRNAKKSIDICCWGFDPAMELERGPNSTWPRGQTYGDLLIDAGRRGVSVRLLVWLDKMAASAGQARNMPGITHDTWTWRTDEMTDERAHALSAQNSLATLRATCADPGNREMKGRFYVLTRKNNGTPITEQEIPLLARAEYCNSWYRAAIDRKLKNVQIRTHSGDARSIIRALRGERNPPEGAERLGMEFFGTHHQKPVLIDFDYEGGSKAVGYVMGLNSVTDYWDSVEHRLEDACREQVSPREAHATSVDERGFETLKPYRDYACRIDCGGALVPLYNNFIAAWDRVDPVLARHGKKVHFNGEQGGSPCPPVLEHPPNAGDSTVQIVRTQPTEQDQTIREIYFKAAENASLAFRYLYVENQYFQYEDWAKCLMEKRKEVVALWNKARAETGKNLSEMPFLHIFVVIPVPERSEMIPRTYETLGRLGQERAMTGQQEMIDSEKKRVEIEKKARQHPLAGTLGHPQTVGMPMKEVIRYESDMEVLDPRTLESVFGTKVCAAMLNACDWTDNRWRYREIYIHSKLLLIDDVFCTLGSANINQRSMVADSELNIALIDPEVVGSLRKRIFSQLNGSQFDGGDGERKDIERYFNDCSRLMSVNSGKKRDGERLSGFLLSLEDVRSSTHRLG